MNSESSQNNITHFDLGLFNQYLQNSNDLFLVDFWAEWCGPCKLMNPYLEKISNLEKYQGRLKIGKVDTDSNPELSQKYQITGIPCFIFIKFDKETGEAKELSRIVGAMDYITFVNTIDQFLESKSL